MKKSRRASKKQQTSANTKNGITLDKGRQQQQQLFDSVIDADSPEVAIQKLKMQQSQSQNAK